MDREHALKDIEQAEEYLRQAKEQLAAMDETYSIGDRFICHNDKFEGDKYLLATTDGQRVGLISLERGRKWLSGGNISNENKITKEEMKKIQGANDFTRYWDSQKKEYVNGYTKENH